MSISLGNTQREIEFAIPLAHGSIKKFMEKFTALDPASFALVITSTPGYIYYNTEIF